MSILFINIYPYVTKLLLLKMNFRIFFNYKIKPSILNSFNNVLLVLLFRLRKNDVIIEQVKYKLFLHKGTISNVIRSLHISYQKFCIHCRIPNILYITYNKSISTKHIYKKYFSPKSFEIKTFSKILRYML